MGCLCVICSANQFDVHVRAVDGKWFRTKEDKTIPDPLTGEPFISYPLTSASEAQPFIDSLRRVPKTGCACRHQLWTLSGTAAACSLCIDPLCHISVPHLTMQALDHPGTLAHGRL